MQPPDYTFDAKRLATLKGFNILDTPAEPGFDDIVHLTAQICETPVSLVSFVAEDRQWFKADDGAQGARAKKNQTRATGSMSMAGAPWAEPARLPLRHSALEGGHRQGWASADFFSCASIAGASTKVRSM